MGEDGSRRRDSLRASLIDSGWSLPPEPGSNRPAAESDESDELDRLLSGPPARAPRPPPPPPPPAQRAGPPPGLASAPPSRRSKPPPPPSKRASPDAETEAEPPPAAAESPTLSSNPPRELPPYPERRDSLTQVDELLQGGDPHEALTTRAPLEQLLAAAPEAFGDGPTEHDVPTKRQPQLEDETSAAFDSDSDASESPLPAFDLPDRSVAASPEARVPGGAELRAADALPSFDFPNASSPATSPAAVESPLPLPTGTSSESYGAATGGPAAADETQPRGRMDSMPSFKAGGFGAWRLLRQENLVRAGAFVAVGAVGAVAGYALGGATAPAPEPAVASAPSAAPGRPAPREADSESEPEPEPEPVTLVERARKGDAQALGELAKKDDRNAEEVVAISFGEQANALREVQELRALLKERPAALEEKETARRVIELARDDDTARTTLAMLAELQTSASADVIYEVWTGTRGRTDATVLAEALVYTNDLRPKASEALAVALDLRAAETCEERKSIIKRTLEFGDRRSLHLLGKLGARRGCGPAKRQDCNPCLRDDKLLVEAIRAVRGRPGPEY